MTGPELAVRVPPEATRARYALDVLLSLLGLKVRDAAAGEPADVAYGPLEARVRVPAGPQDGWDDRVPGVRRADGLAALELAPADARGDTGLGVDLLYATYASLTAPWERDDPADEVGAPIAAEGWLARNGLLEEPLVHRYADRLGRTLREAGVDVPPRPAPLIVLTHDVDNNFGGLFGVRESWALFRRDAARGRPAAVRRALGLARRLARRGGDPNDRFDEWASEHRRWGGRASYFVASHGLFHPEGARQDVPYDVRHPEVRRTLREAIAGGAEVGLHLSIGARESADRIRREREALEDALGQPVRSARHHWWALGPRPERTLRLHADAGLEVDCSFGWNDRIGFRRGIAAPFQPFDTEAERALPVVALPTLAMDAAVAASGGETGLQALYRTVAEVGGVLVLDWHAHALNPAALPGAAETLRRFLDGAVTAGARLATPLEAVRSRLA